MLAGFGDNPASPRAQAGCGEIPIREACFHCAREDRIGPDVESAGISAAGVPRPGSRATGFQPMLPSRASAASCSSQMKARLEPWLHQRPAMLEDQRKHAEGRHRGEQARGDNVVDRAYSVQLGPGQNVKNVSWQGRHKTHPDVGHERYRANAENHIGR